MEAGGEIVAQGTPEVVAAAAGSFTGKYLAPLLKGRGAEAKVVKAGAVKAKRVKAG